MAEDAYGHAGADEQSATPTFSTAIRELQFRLLQCEPFGNAQHGRIVDVVVLSEADARAEGQVQPSWLPCFDGDCGSESHPGPVDGRSSGDDGHLEKLLAGRAGSRVRDEICFVDTARLAGGGGDFPFNPQVAPRAIRNADSGHRQPPTLLA